MTMMMIMMIITTTTVIVKTVIVKKKVIVMKIMTKNRVSMKSIQNFEWQINVCAIHQPLMLQPTVGWF